MADALAAAKLAKLNFLHASANLCSATAPATSAQLMLQRHIEMASDTRPSSKNGSDSSCKACGTIFIPGWTLQTSIVEKRASKLAIPKSGSKKHPGSLLSAEKYVRVKCLACHRFEDTLLQKTRISHRGETAKVTSQATIPTDAERNLDPGSSSLEKSTKASKRRDRARKNKSGLQAILEKSRTPAASSSGFGLDLLDLMKHG